MNDRENWRWRSYLCNRSRYFNSVKSFGFLASISAHLHYCCVFTLSREAHDGHFQDFAKCGLPWKRPFWFFKNRFASQLKALRPSTCVPNFMAIHAILKEIWPFSIFKVRGQNVQGRSQGHWFFLYQHCVSYRTSCMWNLVQFCSAVLSVACANCSGRILLGKMYKTNILHPWRDGV